MAARFEYYDTGDQDTVTIYGDKWQAQTFTPSTSHFITSVKLLIYRYSTPGTLTVAIKNVDGNDDPTGDDLCSGTTNADTLTEDTGGEWREITMDAPYVLSSGTQYAIVVRCGPVQYVGWRINGFNPSYSGGNQYYSIDGGDTWVMKGEPDRDDAMFEEWGTKETPFPTHFRQ